MKSQPKQPAAAREKGKPMGSLQNIIAEADRGQIVEDAELAIQDILTALADEHDRKGEMTIKIKFKTKNGVVQISPSLTHKISEPERLTTTMFLNDEGELTRRDPRQPVMSPVVEADELNRRRNRGPNEGEDK